MDYDHKTFAERYIPYLLVKLPLEVRYIKTCIPLNKKTLNQRKRAKKLESVTTYDLCKSMRATIFHTN